MALATQTTQGEIQLAGDLGGNNDATAPELSTSGVVAGQYILPQLTIDAKGRITAAQGGDPSTISALLQNASSTQKGVVQAGAGLDVTTGDTAGYQEISFASGSPLTPLSIDGSEITGLDTCAAYQFDINVDALATQTIIVSGNVATIQDVVDEINLTLSGAIASIAGGSPTVGKIRITSNTTGRDSFIEIVNDSLFGCMTDFSVIETLVRGTADCEMFAVDATDTSKGVVQIGANIDVVGGVISVDDFGAPATTTTLGSVIVPAAGNIDVDVSGNISVPNASDTELGVLTVTDGNGLVLDGASNLTFTPDTATTTTAGYVIVPAAGNIDVDGSGNISVPVSSPSVLGVAKVGNGLEIDGGGVLSASIATPTTIGMVSAGAGITVDGAGEITATAIPDATTSSKGVVQIGDGIDVATGIISLAPATNTVLGGVKSADTSNIDITAGDLDVGVNISKLDTASTFTAAQVVSQDTLTFAANISTNASLSNTFEVTLTGNTTLDNPTNMVAGGRYTWVIKQDGVGSHTMTFDTSFKFKSGGETTLSTAPNSVDILTGLSDGTNIYCALAKGFA